MWERRNWLCYNLSSPSPNNRWSAREQASAEGVSKTMSSNLKLKLRLAGAVAALATLALAASCRGFFVNPTLSSISINPTAPQVQEGKTLNLQAYGTYSDNNRRLITTGVSWSSDTPSVASVDPNSGILSGVATGTATITASAQGLSSTATATVYIVLNSITITPTSASVNPGGSQNFTVSANGGTDITSAAILTPQQNGQTVSTITCSYVSPYQVCTAASNATTGQYQIVASYSGTTLTATATLNVN